MRSNIYKVVWTKTALRALFNMYNIDHDRVYKNSINLLREVPYEKADKIADYENYKYNGYCLKLINNVLVVYSVNIKNYTVRVRACYYGGSAETAQILYNIKPPYTNY